MFRKRPPLDPLAHVDAAGVPPRFHGAVADAVEARARFGAVVGGVRPGPTRDRLMQLGEQVDAGVLAVWETVQRATELERIATGLDAEDATADLKRARRDPSTAPAVLDALEERFSSIQRLLNSVDDVESRLELLDARLGAAVARAAEVAVAASDDVADGVSRELDAVVGELGALRDSLRSF